MTETKILEDGEVDETRWAHAVTVGIRAAVADQIKT